MAVIGLDLGHTTVVEAEHWLADLPPVPGLVACTHFAAGRVLVTVEGIGVTDLPPRPTRAVPHDGAALSAGAAHTARRAGRAVIYPGVRHLTGSLTVADLIASSAIETVRVIGGAVVVPEPETLVDTRAFVRPQWMHGRLTLVATPAPGGRIAPFEVPNPTPCCAAHS